MGFGKAFIFGLVCYYIFTGVFGMSFWGSFTLTAICTLIIDTVILPSKNDNKENDSDNDENKKA